MIFFFKFDLHNNPHKISILAGSASSGQITWNYLQWTFLPSTFEGILQVECMLCHPILFWVSQRLRMWSPRNINHFTWLEFFTTFFLVITIKGFFNQLKIWMKWLKRMGSICVCLQGLLKLVNHDSSCLQHAENFGMTFPSPGLHCFHLKQSWTRVLFNLET